MDLSQQLVELQDIVERAGQYTPKRDGNGPEAMRQLFRDLGQVAGATIALIEAHQSPGA